MESGKMKLEFGRDQDMKEWVGVTNKVYGLNVAETNKKRLWGSECRRSIPERPWIFTKMQSLTKKYLSVPSTLRKEKRTNVYLPWNRVRSVPCMLSVALFLLKLAVFA
jgi:hypothetical protein